MMRDGSVIPEITSPRPKINPESNAMTVFMSGNQMPLQVDHQRRRGHEGDGGNE